MKTPNQENLIDSPSDRKIYYYCDSAGNAIHKSKEISPIQRIFVFYPYNLNRQTEQVKPKRLKVVEFRGWRSLEDLPKDFRKTPGYGFNSASSKQFLNRLYKKFPKLEKLVIVVNGQTRFSTKTITLNWGDFESAIKQINRERFLYDRSRKILTNNVISTLTNKVTRIERTLTAGELEYFLSKFDSYDKISHKDIDALTQILSDLPRTKITTTEHIIKTKEKIDLIYLEDIIKQYEKLMRVNEDNEEEWQNFFQNHTWTLNHLFPYEVVLSKGKAFVGGKTFENAEGRIVDFLFQTGFKDNFALLEIKTPKKQLLKNLAYRAPSVFSVSDELSGGVNQCLDQKDIFMRDLGQKYQSLDPKSILLIGQKNKLSIEQAKCFELFRANQKNIDVVTFDELQTKLSGLYEVITGKKSR